MFTSNPIVRLFSSTPSVWNASKSNLAKLRKKTGYTFANCKKALVMHNDDFAQAEKWLHDQAQALGWSKATNLGGRKASEGLVAVAINKNHGAMVELNCETDFVSRNSSFQSLIKLIANSCLSVVPQVCETKNPLSKECLDSKKLNVLLGPDGKSLADHVALTIGLVGENMVLKRAILMSTSSDILLSGYSHPAPASLDEPMLGKYGAMVAICSKDKKPLTEESHDLGKQLCQHVVGMNPSIIGDCEKDQPQENADDETVLIYQDFLLDPESKVQEVLDQRNIQVLDFVRYECGETQAEADENSAAAAQG